MLMTKTSVTEVSITTVTETTTITTLDALEKARDNRVLNLATFEAGVLENRARLTAEVDAAQARVDEALALGVMRAADIVE